MYGEPCVEDSQTAVVSLESRSACWATLGAAGCAAAMEAAIIRRIPANTVAHWTTGVMSKCLLTLIPISLIHPCQIAINNHAETNYFTLVCGAEKPCVAWQADRKSTRL